VKDALLVLKNAKEKVKGKPGRTYTRDADREGSTWRQNEGTGWGTQQISLGERLWGGVKKGFGPREKKRPGGGQGGTTTQNAQLLVQQRRGIKKLGGGGARGGFVRGEGAIDLTRHGEDFGGRNDLNGSR